ncbi:MAG: C_GCAxxG_C_C family protein [Oscillospiraceae bacterium]|nr:C_GCAxxG_C_C family protein [Oscillospiraceae bacterium]
MNIEERAELAVARKAQGLCNCCQTVALALADQTPLSEEQLRNMAAGFAVGMGNMEGTCGALVAAVAVAGLQSEGRNTLRLARQISEGFRSRSGAVVCRELKGSGSGQPLCSCEDCVRNALRAYDEVVGLR